MYNVRISGIFRLCIVLSIISLFVGCGGGGGGSAATGSSPTITNFTPTSGNVGDTVTITGTNFSTTWADNTVSFNGTAAVVYSCTSTRIVTAVPERATTGPIEVTVVGNSVTSLTAFTAAVTLPASAGYYNDGTKDIPCYWTRTLRTDLSGDGTHDAYASSIDVSNSTIYTAGYYSDGKKGIPCYWTGTLRTDLSGDGIHDGYANSITVSGSTVYTAGYYSDGTKDVPRYWTGTTHTDLPGDGTHWAHASSITVSGGTVYTAGSYSDGVKDIPCYWTGTTRTDLVGDGTHDAQVYSVF